MTDKQVAAHTPGPWHYETSDDGMVLWVGCPQHTVATVHNTADRVEIGAMQANARLIAAAPELLEACKALIAYCDKNPPMGDSLWSVQQIRAAIKKAEGAA